MDGVPVEGSGGRHIFILVTDGSDIPRVIETMHKRLVNAGLGWIFISEAGSRLLRSLVDATVNKPNGLAFEGAPVLERRLTQDHEARRPEVIDGPALDTKTAFPLLTAAEDAQFEIAKDNLRHKAAKAGERQGRRLRPQPGEDDREEDRKGIRDGAAPGKDAAPAEAGAGMALEFDDPDIGTTTVADVTADPAAYAGETLADPMEGLSTRPGQGDGHARQGDRPSVHQLLRAWRRIVYELTLDEKAMAEAIDKADRKPCSMCWRNY